MNKRQKEILQSHIKDERHTISELKQVYKKARDDVLANIKALEARTDVENIQSIIYQKQYQEALKKQLDAILDSMNATQFQTISDYLLNCYENGFVGVMYDLHGQGIPIITPINQDQVVKAIQTDSKISEGLYKRLGVDTRVLKDSIRANVSRGIASNLPWADVALNIDNRMNIGLNRSMRIARTEGHRIQAESAFDAQKSAKEKGADVVKQWDATLDGRTRPDHAQLDGQIREVDEPFEVNGHKAMYPGAFGTAAEDCNCRCAILQRAKWALDDGFTKYDNFTGESRTFNSPKDYGEFKKWYFSDENVKYMKYVSDLENKYETKNFNTLLSNMSEREYEHFHKLESESPLWNFEKRKIHLDDEELQTLKERAEYFGLDKTNRKEELENNDKNAIIKIDELTPCLRRLSDGKIIDTTVEVIVPKKGEFNDWEFDWSIPSKNGYTIHAIKANGDDRIQGMVAFKPDPSNYAIMVDIVEAAPFNNPHNKLFVEKEYSGVGGHLFAEAVKQSYENDFDGFVYFKAKTDLIEHYQNELGAVLINPRERIMAIDERSAKKLYDRYYKGK